MLIKLPGIALRCIILCTEISASKALLKIPRLPTSVLRVSEIQKFQELSEMTCLTF